MNIVASFPEPIEAWARVLKIQTKLHQWAIDDAARRFDDLWNLVCDPAVLMDAWQRVRSSTFRRLKAGRRKALALDARRPLSVLI